MSSRESSFRGPKKTKRANDVTRALLKDAATRAVKHMNRLQHCAVWPGADAVARLTELACPLPQHSTDPAAVLALLDEVGSPATVASAGGRYFGFVTGGSLPVTLAANWIAGAWDQNAGLVVQSPAAVALEEIALRWLKEIFHLPADAGGGVVTGATMANFTALAAARQGVLRRVGWDVESRGLFGAPLITVIVGEEVHVSVMKALGLLGLGRERVVRVPVDGQGRMRADGIPQLREPSIVCIQAGNVNTGAFDPAREICRIAHQGGAWVHVDGAFGLWAWAAPERAKLVAGMEEADSWAVDAHKWLNVPYDSGIAFSRHPSPLRAAMSVTAPYLMRGQQHEPCESTPEMSRRARGVEIWAALRSLGKRGLEDLVERTCRFAQRFAEGLRTAGYEVLNDVVLNQVMVSFGGDDVTRRIIRAVQEEGTCWCGGTLWQGHTAMRISVSSWATTAEDVERSLEVICRIAAGETRGRTTESPVSR